MHTHTHIYTLTVSFVFTSRIYTVLSLVRAPVQSAPLCMRMEMCTHIYIRAAAYRLGVRMIFERLRFNCASYVNLLLFSLRRWFTWRCIAARSLISGRKKKKKSKEKKTIVCVGITGFFSPKCKGIIGCKQDIFRW